MPVVDRKGDWERRVRFGEAEKNVMTHLSPLHGLHDQAVQVVEARFGEDVAASGFHVGGRRVVQAQLGRDAEVRPGRVVARGRGRPERSADLNKEA